MTSLPEEEQPVVCMCVCFSECFGLIEVHGVGTVACQLLMSAKNGPCPQRVSAAGTSPALAAVLLGQDGTTI